MEAILLRNNYCKKFFTVLVCAALSAFFCFSLTGCSTDEGSAPQLKSATLDTPTIQESGVLKVGVNTSQSPMAGMGNSKIIGIDVDAAAALADSLGLKLKIVDTGSNPSKALSNGEVDIVFGVDGSDTPSGAKLTSEYVPTTEVIFKLKGSNTQELSSNSTPKIAAQASSKSAWSVTNTFGSDALVSTSDLASAFQSMKSGDAEFVAADAVIGMYAANKAELDVEIVAMTDSASGYCVAVSDKNSALYTAVSSAMTELVNNGTIATIEKKWLGSLLDLSGVQKVEKKSSSSADSGSGNSSADSHSSATATESSGSAAVATDANSVIRS